MTQKEEILQLKQVLMSIHNTLVDIDKDDLTKAERQIQVKVWNALHPEDKVS